MSKPLVEIKGFDELQRKLKQLPDKVKKREVIKLLRQSATATYNVMKQLTPQSSGFITTNGKRYARKKRQIGKTVIAENYVPGYGKKTIAKKVLRKSKNPMLVVGPQTRKGKDGYYLRQWIVAGTKYIKPNPFVERAYNITKGQVTKEAEIKTEKYIQKQINRLNLN